MCYNIHLEKTMFMTILFCMFLQNVIDSYVKHTNSGVSMAAMTLMLHITKDMPSVCQDVYKRLKGEYQSWNETPTCCRSELLQYNCLASLKSQIWRRHQPSCDFLSGMRLTLEGIHVLTMIKVIEYLHISNNAPWLEANIMGTCTHLPTVHTLKLKYLYISFWLRCIVGYAQMVNCDSPCT